MIQPKAVLSQTIMINYYDKLICQTTNVGTIDNSAQSFIEQSLKVQKLQQQEHLLIQYSSCIFQKLESDSHIILKIVIHERMNRLYTFACAQIITCKCFFLLP